MMRSVYKSNNHRITLNHMAVISCQYIRFRSTNSLHIRHTDILSFWITLLAVSYGCILRKYMNNIVMEETAAVNCL